MYPVLALHTDRVGNRRRTSAKRLQLCWFVELCWFHVKQPSVSGCTDDSVSGPRRIAYDEDEFAIVTGELPSPLFHVKRVRSPYPAPPASS